MTRKEAREQAFLVLFQCNFFADRTLEEILENNLKNGSITENKFTNQLCSVVFKNMADINSLIQKYSLNWEQDRITKVSLTALRIAIAEIKYIEGIPEKVSLNEAIELTKKFANQEDAQFVNGVLSGVVNEFPKD